MMTSKLRRKVALSLFALSSITGCGTGTEPLSALNDPNTIPQLTIPFSYPGTPVTTVSPYSTTGTIRDGFDFNVAGGTASYSVFAPAPGIVTNTDGNSVTIYHNARFSTRISMINVGTTPGTVVTSANIIGTGPMSATPTVLAHLQVILDGSVVCPYFFLTGGDATQKINVNTWLSGTYPCQ